MKIFLLLLNLYCSICIAKGWEFEINQQNQEEGVIALRDGGNDDLREVISNIPKGKTVTHIFLGRLVQLERNGLQNEIYDLYKKEAAIELQRAFNSSGNLHNKALKPLEALFNRAVLESSYVESLNNELRKFGYKVHEVEHEKFFLIKGKTNRVDAMIWLKLKQRSTKKPVQQRIEKATEI